MIGDGNEDGDGIDKLLVLFGTLGCIGDGLMSPLTMVILSGVINEYGGGNPSFSNKVVDKYALRLLYLAIGVGISAFIEGICWTRTAERQTSRLRMEYLKSVLRQEVGFFDTQIASSTNFQVISAISSDALLIQDVMAEKVFRSSVFSKFWSLLLSLFSDIFIISPIYSPVDTQLHGSPINIYIQHFSGLPAFTATRFDFSSICTNVCGSRVRHWEFNEGSGNEDKGCL